MTDLFFFWYNHENKLKNQAKHELFLPGTSCGAERDGMWVLYAEDIVCLLGFLLIVFKILSFLVFNSIV